MFLKMKFGSELLTIEQEIEKASIYIGNNKSISGRDVEFLSTGVATCSIFDLTPLFASKNKKKMLEITYKLLEAGEPPILINNIISSRMQKLLLTHDLVVAGASDGELASQTSTPPFYVRDLKTEAKKYKRDELAKMYKRCMYIDSELKSAKREDFDILISGALKLMERI
jgi:DNA polymerase-3 subunit delta